ncbi:hypothetical protein E3N88_39503 [Mikania micrantha]|uniref:DYW domain-containing protein n=1 Tax=Mikania micrantha TaxID=192012 RepID=A0A5N6LWZ4_9ASTR|nr:hypothetical protein E3N88_39503 [Mikania micrantha]
MQISQSNLPNSRSDHHQRPPISPPVVLLPSTHRHPPYLQLRHLRPSPATEPPPNPRPLPPLCIQSHHQSLDFLLEHHHPLTYSALFSGKRVVLFHRNATAMRASGLPHLPFLFDEMLVGVRDAATWGTMLAGYAQTEHYDRCLDLYDQMIVLGVLHDNVSLVSVLSACARMGKLEKGKQVHDHIIHSRIQIDSFLCTALVDFYAKCGCIETARRIFEASPDKNIFTWNAMLVGLAMHGDGELLLSYFSKMVKNKVKPDGVTFLGVLVGCSHAGLIKEARRLYGEMGSVYGVPKELKHYGCMADLLARAGLIKEAMEMIESMPMSGDVFVWGSLLGGCRLHGNVKVAEKAAEHIMEISPEDGGVYSTMADIYANAKRWDDLTKIRRLRDSRRVKKNAGCSLIQLDGVTHEFVAGDDLHPQSHQIYLVLNGIGQHQFQMQL